MFVCNREVRGSNRIPTGGLVAFTLLALSACSGEQPPTGGAELSVRALGTQDVTSVVVTGSGSALPAPKTFPLSPRGSATWGALLSALPVASDYTFTVSALDLSNVTEYAGSASGVAIVKDHVTTVIITAQQTNAPVPFKNAIPVIDSVVMSSGTIAPGGTITATATAHDPNPGDTITFAWSASSEAGVFSAPSAASTTWTAPATEGDQTLVLLVADNHGASASVSIVIHVASTGGGQADVNVNFNNSPVVTDLLAAPGHLVLGSPTSLTVTASDADGDALSYAWTSTCTSGVFSNTTAPATSFTLPAVATDTSCDLVVTVSDGRGGSTTGQTTLLVGQPAAVGVPVIADAGQSAFVISSGGSVTLTVAATDPQASALSFHWVSAAGALSNQVDAPGSSQVVWTTPATGNGTFTVSVKVTNALGVSVRNDFTVSVPGADGGAGGAAGTDGGGGAGGATPEGAPGTACTVPSDCAGYSCTNQVCGPYATSCLALRNLSAPPGQYTIDTDGVGGNPPFLAYCPTGSPSLAPVGISQAEVGAPPASRSFVGAVGYDFNGVDFSGTMKDGGLLNWLGQPVTADQDVTELADGSLLTSTAYSWCCYGSDTWVRYYTVGNAGIGASALPSPQGIIELFDQRILVGGSGIYLVSKTGSSPAQINGSSAYYPIQLASGKILLPANSVNEIILLNPDGTVAGTVSDPTFTATSLYTAVQLADGAIVIGGGGLIKYFEPDLTPRAFASAPSGMTLNPDGSLSRLPEMSGTSGMLVQLPNGQILFSDTASTTIVRLNADGSYVDTFTLPSNYAYPRGMTVDHHGRLLVPVGNTHQVRVVTFPGCSDGTRDGSETDVDCGGSCTKKCGTNQTCNVDADCVSGSCWNTVCQ